MLHPAKSEKNYIDEESITMSLMLLLRLVRKFRSEIFALQPYCLVLNSHAPFG